MAKNERSVFARYVDSPPEKDQPPVTIPREPLLGPVVPPADYGSPPIEKPLDFVVNRWRKPAIRLREVCKFGPGSIRTDRKNAIALAEALAANGWLVPTKGRQHNERMWLLVRAPLAAQQTPQMPQALSS
jgi:hypothetical protein